MAGGNNPFTQITRALTRAQNNEYMLKKIKFWRKKNKPAIDEAKDAGKEVAIFVSTSSPQNIQENRKIFLQKYQEYLDGKISQDVMIKASKMLFIVLSSFTNAEQDEITKCIMDVELGIKKEEPFTADEYDIYHEIISYIHDKRQEKIKTLLKKAAQKISDKKLSISKETIDFIASITDSQLVVIQEIFRYVVGNGILKYKNIANDFRTKNFNQSGSDNIKFLGKIFYNQDAVGGKSYTPKVEAVKIHDILIWKYIVPTIILKGIPATEESLKEHLSDEKNRKDFHVFLKTLPVKGRILDQEKAKFYITKQPTSEGKISIDISCFVILTDMGAELYSLLRDEIKDYPDHYLKSVVDDEQYKNFGLMFEVS